MTDDTDTDTDTDSDDPATGPTHHIPGATLSEPEPPKMSDAWFRWQNRMVMSCTACHTCGGSIPWSHDFSWKFIGAGGCLVGPFCSPECFWAWMNGDRADPDPEPDTDADADADTVTYYILKHD